VVRRVEHDPRPDDTGDYGATRGILPRGHVPGLPAGGAGHAGLRHPAPTLHIERPYSATAAPDDDSSIHYAHLIAEIAVLLVNPEVACHPVGALASLQMRALASDYVAAVNRERAMADRLARGEYHGGTA